MRTHVKENGNDYWEWKEAKLPLVAERLSIGSQMTLEKSTLKLGSGFIELPQDFRGFEFLR
jgi:hypothetical protein